MRLRLIILVIGILNFSNSFFAQGTVKGKLCFPSYYIPEMTVYLKNVQSNEILKLKIKEDERSFKFKNVPKGKYVAYAYTLDEIITDKNGNTTKGKGGYTQLVPCGLSVECKDHSLIQFEVISNKKTKGIDICDWYDAEIPKE
ncbi:MAG: hypothetical protein ABI207_06370 [Crocinitomicaceae bacterium]